MGIRLDFRTPKLSRDYILIPEKKLVRFSIVQDTVNKADCYFSAKIFVKTKSYEGPAKDNGFLFNTELLDEFLMLFNEVVEEHELSLDVEEIGRTMSINDNDTLHIRISEYAGEYGFDMRVWTDTDKYTGWTLKGIRVPMIEMRNMLEFLEKLNEDALALGL